MLFRVPSSEPHLREYDRHCSLAQPVVHGDVQRRQVGNDPNLQYNLFVSRALTPETPLFVAVHGIRRGVDSQARLFAPLVDQYGGVLVAPLFEKGRFSDYQRLGRRGKGARADLALKRIVADVSRILGLSFPQLVMFGYSGGGQFVHRYAMAHPRQVKRMAVAAPGWFTFPDMNQPFPRGIRRTSLLPDIIFDPARFLKIPTLAMVGEKDVLQDAALNQNKKIGAQQGMTRVERARHWVSAMSAYAAQFNLDTPFSLEILAGCGHSFIDCMQTGKMGPMVVDFLFHDPAVKRPQSTSQPSTEMGQTILQKSSDERFI